MFIRALSSFGVDPRYLFTLVMLLAAVPHPGDAGTPQGPGIEIFVTGDAVQLEESTAMMVYRIDAIHQLQTTLSQGLPGDPQAAQDIVLARITRLDTGLDRSLENAVRGLARAMHYGIDRVPAIVFDRQAVIYGITDIDAARQIWRSWKAQTNE